MDRGSDGMKSEVPELGGDLELLLSLLMWLVVIGTMLVVGSVLYRCLFLS